MISSSADRENAPANLSVGAMEKSNSARQAIGEANRGLGSLRPSR